MEIRAQHQAPHYMSRVFRACAVLAFVIFVALAVAVHTTPYFRIDLAITRFIQGYHGGLFDSLMVDLSWLGYPPQVEIIALLCLAGLYLRKYRWEAVAGLFSLGGAAFGVVIKMIVHRPRPGGDLVHVARQISSAGFPSGHVLTFTCFFGFLAFLAFTLLRPHRGRLALVTILVLLIAAMGVSRIYLGEHWFSDVIGGYLLGTVWLALTIEFYWWGKGRYLGRRGG